MWSLSGKYKLKLNQRADRKIDGQWTTSFFDRSVMIETVMTVFFFSVTCCGVLTCLRSASKKKRVREREREREREK